MKCRGECRCDEPDGRPCEQGFVGKHADRDMQMLMESARGRGRRLFERSDRELLLDESRLWSAPSAPAENSTRGWRLNS